MAQISKTWRLFKRYAAISVALDSEFRTDFLSGIFLQLLNAAMMILFWDGLARAAGGIPGWGMGDLVLMTGMQQVSFLVGHLFFRMGELPGKVLKGQLDRYLTRPAPAFLCLQWESLYIRSMAIQALSAGIVIAVALFGWGFRPVPGGILPGLLLLTIGTLIQCCLETTVAALSFWVGRVDGLRAIFGEVDRFKRFPVTLFHPPVRGLLTWVWPFGLYVTYPVMLMRGQIQQVWPLLGGALALLLAWVVLLNRLLQAGLRRYESFGG